MSDFNGKDGDNGNNSVRDGIRLVIHLYFFAGIGGFRIALERVGGRQFF